ncbi:MAG TPA: glycosyltransferase family 2 protein, partial [Trueperaceae bacterium]|nr:glycosyltransferase family 2 protein [Trueperaceae bacterium]
NSTDGTKEALNNLNFNYKIKLIDSDIDLPVTKARNLCVQAANAKYLYFSDDDCILEADVLEQHLAAQKKQPCVSLGAIIFEDDSAAKWQPFAKYWYTNGANTTVPKQAFELVGGFDEDLKSYGLEDLLLGYELGLKNLAFVVLPEAVVHHIGKSPLTGHDLSKAYSAGQNSVIVTKKYPELKFRLGITNWLLWFKKILYLSPLQIISKRFVENFDYERVYLMAVLEQKQIMEEKDV